MEATQVYGMIDSKIEEALTGAGALKGDKGDKGDTGPIGPAGAQGIQGPQGEPGQNGTNGTNGLQGPQGIQGATGQKGDKGDDGTSFALSKVYGTVSEMTTDANPVNDGLMVAVVGDNGAECYIRNSKFCPNLDENDSFQGYKFLLNLAEATVIRGPKGDKGDTGDTGAQGPQGIQGPVGEKGPQGPQGIQGIQGQKGDTGSQGPQGIQGEKGNTGAVGPQGPPVSVIDNLTSTSTDEALSANMGRELLEQINVLSNDRGYVTAKTFSNMPWYMIKDNGFYILIDGSDMPNSTTQSTFLLQVVKMSDDYVYYKAMCLYSNAGDTGKSFERYILSGTAITGWQQIATANMLQSTLDALNA